MPCQSIGGIKHLLFPDPLSPALFSSCGWTKSGTRFHPRQLVRDFLSFLRSSRPIRSLRTGALVHAVRADLGRSGVEALASRLVDPPMTYGPDCVVSGEVCLFLGFFVCQAKGFTFLLCPPPKQSRSKQQVHRKSLQPVPGSSPAMRLFLFLWQETFPSGIPSDATGSEVVNQAEISPAREVRQVMRLEDASLWVRYASWQGGSQVRLTPY